MPPFITVHPVSIHLPVTHAVCFSFQRADKISGKAPFFVQSDTEKAYLATIVSLDASNKEGNMKMYP